MAQLFQDYEDVNEFLDLSLNDSSGSFHDDTAIGETAIITPTTTTTQATTSRHHSNEGTGNYLQHQSNNGNITSNVSKYNPAENDASTVLETHKKSGNK